MRVLAAACLALAVVASIVTAILILRLPEVPKAEGPVPHISFVAIEAARDANREDRNNYLAAGAIVIVTLLAAAAILEGLGSRTPADSD